MLLLYPGCYYTGSWEPLVHVVHLTYLRYQCFLMTYDNKYVFPFSNMSFIYTGFTLSLITGTFL